MAKNILDVKILERDFGFEYNLIVPLEYSE